MLLALFFVLRRGAKLATHLSIAAKRLFGEPGVRLASTIADSVRATVNGTAVAALDMGWVLLTSFAMYRTRCYSQARQSRRRWFRSARGFLLIVAALTPPWRELACKRRATRNRNGCTYDRRQRRLAGPYRRGSEAAVLAGSDLVFSLDRSLWQWSLRCGANGSTATIEPPDNGLVHRR